MRTRSTRPGPARTRLSEQSKDYFDGGHLELVIEDETGKVNINKLVEGNGFNNAVKGVLSRLLSQPQFKLQDREVEDILNAIKDWIDADAEVTATGAENAYYQGLGKSYTVRNGPMESIDELLLVRGISRELFYGTSERPGLARLLTVHGEGSININTAPKEVLRALCAVHHRGCGQPDGRLPEKRGKQPHGSLLVQKGLGIE